LNASPAAVTAHAQTMQAELAAIKEMVGHVLQRQVVKGSSPVPTMPAKLFDMYLKLISQDVSEELADQVVNEVRDELSIAELDDPQAVRSAVLRHLANFIPVVDQPDLTAPTKSGMPKIIALIGPTGVGKTTTLAKLAASLRLRQQRKVGLITCDTYRIAAVDQLRTYASIIGLQLKVVLTAAEMKQAIDTMRDNDVILIDTAGRGQNDSDRLEELRQFIDAASPDEVHLVLSSTASEKVLLQEAKAFSAIRTDRIVLTKLDEAVSFGVLVNVMRQIGKQLSFITTGQEVPDQFEPGRAQRIAELVLGGEVRP